MNLTGEKLQLKYIPLDQVVLWDDNPKKHDIGALIASIEKYGYVDPAKFDPNLNNGKGGLVYGNGRSQCVQMLRDDPEKEIVPRGVCTDSDGNWYLPVLFGVDAESEAVARALAIDHNNLTMAGGDFDLWEMAKMWEQQDYAALLESLQTQDAVPITMDRDDIAAFLRIIEQGINGAAYDESIADGIELEATFRIKVPTETADALEQALGEVLAEYPNAKMEKII